MVLWEESFFRRRSREKGRTNIRWSSTTTSTRPVDTKWVMRAGYPLVGLASFDSGIVVMANGQALLPGRLALQLKKSKIAPRGTHKRRWVSHAMGSGRCTSALFSGHANLYFESGPLAGPWLQVTTTAAWMRFCAAPNLLLSRSYRRRIPGLLLRSILRSPLLSSSVALLGWCELCIGNKLAGHFRSSCLFVCVCVYIRDDEGGGQGGTGVVRARISKSFPREDGPTSSAQLGSAQLQVFFSCILFLAVAAMKSE